MPGFEHWGEAEKKELADVISSGVLMRYGFEGQRGGHWKARQFEKEISEYTGSPHVHLTSSGTAALETALSALGVGYGDEVILPVFTFVAGFEAICRVGAIPVFADIDETLTLSPPAVEAAITGRTKVIMPVHMCGGMAQMQELLHLSEKYDIPLLEDACQSVGGSYRGRKLGTLGAVGTYSFDFVKTVTAGEGGAILCSSEAIYKKCDAYSDHGHDHLGADRGSDHHPWPGTNFRISELHAAVGLAQFRRLEEFLELQQKNYLSIEEALMKVPGISFRKLPDPAGNCFSFLSWMLPSEKDAVRVISKLRSMNKAAGHFYWYENSWHYLRNWNHLKEGQFLSALPPATTDSILENARRSFPVSDQIMGRCISTAIRLSWNPEEIDQVIADLTRALE